MIDPRVRQGLGPEPMADPESGWLLLLAAARVARRLGCSGDPRSFGWLAPDRLLPLPAGDPRAILHWCPRRGWQVGRALEADGPVRDLVQLYLPLCGVSPGRPLTVAHLGQSLDGYIATASGDSCYVTGPENILHLHRMRALCDAIVVGPGTVAQDDPQLTTRLAPGPNPTRVVLDPARRLDPSLGVFSDGAAATLLFCASEQVRGGAARVGLAEVIGVPARDRRLDLQQVLEALHQRGLQAVFIEGGGVTVSRFLEAGLLDRLQLTIAPLLIGRGRPGIRLPVVEPLADCLRPSHRLYRMGQDLLFDCDLRDGGPKAHGRPPAGAAPRWIR